MGDHIKAFAKFKVGDINPLENLMNYMCSVLQQKYFNVMFSTPFVYSFLLGDICFN